MSESPFSVAARELSNHLDSKWCETNIQSSHEDEAKSLEPILAAVLPNRLKVWVHTTLEGDCDDTIYSIDGVYLVPADFNPYAEQIAFNVKYRDSLKVTNPNWFRKDGCFKLRYASVVHKAWRDHVVATYPSIPFTE